jgi:hypothetical protein
MTPVRLIGTADADNLIGNAGSDNIGSVGAGDIVRGGAGDDFITIVDLGFADIRGGGGFDRLGLSGRGIDLDLTTTPGPKLDSIEQILLGFEGNSVTLDKLAVLNISDDTSEGITSLQITGFGSAPEGAVFLEDFDDWTFAGISIGIGDFLIYTNGAARLFIFETLTVLDPNAMMAAPQAELAQAPPEPIPQVMIESFAFA